MKNLILLVAVSICAVSVCASQAAAQEKLTPEQMKKKIEALEKENARLKKTTAKEAAVSKPSVKAKTDSYRGPFNDIGDCFAAKYIDDLRQLGVFDGVGQAFKPSEPITRGEFVSWMVRAANAIFPQGKGLYTRLDETGKSSFADVPTTHQYFKYIQGLNNTGFLMGYDDKDFRPDQALTREEMIAIKTPFDMQGIPIKKKDYATAEYVKRFWRWDDSAKVSPRYFLVFANEHYSTGKNIERAFGNLRIFKPEEPVTRAEAAACIWQFGPKESNTQNQYFPINAAEVLKKSKNRKS